MYIVLLTLLSAFTCASDIINITYDNSHPIFSSQCIPYPSPLDLNDGEELFKHLKLPLKDISAYISLNNRNRQIGLQGRFYDRATKLENINQADPQQHCWHFIIFPEKLMLPSNLKLEGVMFLGNNKIQFVLTEDWKKLPALFKVEIEKRKKELNNKRTTKASKQ